MADWYFRGNANAGSPQNNNLAVCPGCRNLVRKNEEYCPFCARRLRPEGGVRAWLRRVLNRPFVATRFLIGVIAAIFLLQLVADFFTPAQYKGGGGGGLFSLLTASPISYVRFGSNLHYMVAEYHEYWRFLTACFLHFGLLHILFNCYAFWDLGRLAERMWGAKQVFATFIITGIAGSAASFAWNWYVIGRGVNSAGASGAICGILGLFLGAYLKAKYQVGEFLGSQLIRWAVYIVVFGLVIGADNAAHLGGMAAGAALGYFLPPTQHSRTLVRDTGIWNTAAGAAFAAMVVCFGFAAHFYFFVPV